MFEQCVTFGVQAIGLGLLAAIGLLLWRISITLLQLRGDEIPEPTDARGELIGEAGLVGAVARRREKGGSVDGVLEMRRETLSRPGWRSLV